MKIKDAYERLKEFSDIREKYNLVDEKGNMTMNLGSLDFSNILNQESKKDVIKILCIITFEILIVLEDAYGDIKEPRYLINWLLGIWLFMGFLIFKRDLRNYYHKLKCERAEVDYTKNISHFIFHK